MRIFKYIKSMGLAINVLAGAALLIVVLMDLYLRSVPEIFRYGHQIGEIVYRIALSIIASYVFFLIVVQIKAQKDKENIREHTSTIVRGVIGQGKRVFQTLLEEAGIQRDLPNLTLEDVQFLGPRIKLKKQAPSIVGFLILRGSTFAQYLCFYKDRTVSDIERLFTYIYFLDSDLIRRLNRIIYSRYFILCDQWLKSVDLASDPDLTAFDEDLFEYYQAVMELERYCIKQGILIN